MFSPKKNLKIYLVCREEYFDRKNPYGTGERDYEDNADRYIFFCKAVVEALRLADLQADIVHCHDWQTALLPLLLREQERRHGLHARPKDRVYDSQYRLPGTLPRGHISLPYSTYPKSFPNNMDAGWSTTASDQFHGRREKYCSQTG